MSTTNVSELGYLFFSQTRRKSAVVDSAEPQIVSGRQTFPPIFWLGAEIFARRVDFNARQGSIVRLYFYQTPIFCIPAEILGCAYNTRQCFGHPPIFQAFANIFMRRLDFRHPPIF
jgi:hypothetical protein